MSKHTPGPWKVFQWGDGSQARLNLFNVGSESAEATVVKAISLDDANLIAAAPDMLEALKMAVSGSHDWESYAAEAIAKAESR